MKEYFSVIIDFKKKEGLYGNLFKERIRNKRKAKR